MAKKNATVVNYDPKTTIGKVYARLVANPNGISKEKLYKGLDKNAFNAFAWIKIHGRNFKTWKIADLNNGNVKLIRTAGRTAAKKAA